MKLWPILLEAWRDSSGRDDRLQRWIWMSALQKACAQAVTYASETFERAQADWCADNIPFDDGRVILVKLMPDIHVEAEHYGRPIAVCWWGHKGKTTFGCRRIDPEDIACWRVCPE